MAMTRHSSAFQTWWIQFTKRDIGNTRKQIKYKMGLAIQAVFLPKADKDIGIIED